jgi:hypothetical protein
MSGAVQYGHMLRAYAEANAFADEGDRRFAQPLRPHLRDGPGVEVEARGHAGE